MRTLILAVVVGAIAALGIVITETEATAAEKNIRCPLEAPIDLSHARSIGSNPDFARTQKGKQSSLEFTHKVREGQDFFCYYSGHGLKNIEYRYTVKRSVRSCEEGARPNVWTCDI